MDKELSLIDESDFVQVKSGEFKTLGEYDNLTIVDQNGIVLFYDFADINQIKLLSIMPNELIGRKITSIWANLDDENSTLMRVLRTGKGILNNRQVHKTKGGRSVLTVNSIFPICANDKIVGAIEFNRFYFKKEDIKLICDYSPHKIFRKNNTIYTIDNITTQNSLMEKIKNQMIRSSKTDSSVLIYGATGTGKEMVAQSIHNLSERYNKPYVSVNCAAIPPTLFESLMFGIVKGSFTGSENTIGYFEEANGGTLFLDEINSLDIAVQGKFLQAIEEKKIRKIGGNKYIPIDIRIITATNEDPLSLVGHGRLREDLFYRLGVVQMDIPALADRKEDISLLVNHFIDFFNGKMNVKISVVSQNVMDKFYEYDWPGNIRELRNAVEAAYNNVTSNTITMEDIPQRIRYYKNPETFSENKQGTKLSRMLEETERQIILNELQRTNNKKTLAAKNLGISKQLLNYKINKYSI
ncbi:MAG: sigma-54 interaction domain-containing protein [Clostridiaceae bacterium]